MPGKNRRRPINNLTEVQKDLLLKHLDSERTRQKRPYPPEIVPREEWGPFPIPRSYMPRLNKPVSVVYWTNTKSRVCRGREDCLRVVKTLELLHQKGGMYDIPFNFLIGGDGRIYEGRGWDHSCLVPYTMDQVNEVYQHPHQDNSLVIAHMGRVIETGKFELKSRVTNELITYGIEINAIKPDHETIRRSYWYQYKHVKLVK